MQSFITIKELKKKLANKEISRQDIFNFYQARIQKHNSSINAFIELFEQPINAPTDASTNTNKILNDIPCAIKDNIAQKNQLMTACSNILKNYKAPYNATVTQRLLDHGSYSLGRTNMDEFAMGSSGEYSAYGTTKNPWNTKYSAGGSSSGSAAAVAAGLTPFALGTETGGSVRQPAAFCNLVGLYPTYGLHSRYGVIAFASSTDQVGPLTKTVYDNALVTTALSGHCSKDATSLEIPAKDYTKNLDGKLPENLTVGLFSSQDINQDDIHPAIQKSMEQAKEILQKKGARFKEISLPHFKNGIAVYFILSRAEAASNLSRFDGTLYGNRIAGESLQKMYLNTRHDGFGIEVQRRLLTGNYVLSSAHQGEYYAKADQVRAMIRAEFLDAFNEVDIILSPTTPTLPFELGKVNDDPFTHYLADLFTVSNCITGTPAIAVPGGMSPEGLPIGIQFLGPRLSEELLYKVAYAFEQETEFYKQNPEKYN